MMMDEQFYQSTGGESPFAPVKNAAYYRAYARDRLKNHWGIVILATLVAMLLGAMSNGVSFDLDLTDSKVVESVTREQVQALAEAIRTLDWQGIKASMIDLFPKYALLFASFSVILVVGTVLTVAVRLFVSAPVKVGYQRFQLELIDGNEQKIKVGTLFDFFHQNYLKTVCLELLHGLVLTATAIPAAVLSVLGVLDFAGRVSVLLASGMTDSAPLILQLLGASWGLIGLTLLGTLITCVLNIPVSYMYRYAHMILADYPTVGAVEAMRMSRNLMRGHKWKLFCLEFGFIGWFFLSALTCGIGMIVVRPYLETARTAFYHEISRRDAAKDTEFPSLDPDDYTV